MTEDEMDELSRRYVAAIEAAAASLAALAAIDERNAQAYEAALVAQALAIQAKEKEK